MPKLHIFGIGGTGSRVIESLIHLLASGVDARKYSISPWILDTDKNNGNLESLRNVLNVYHDIQKRMYPSGKVATDDTNRFFRAEIEKLHELSITGQNYDTLRKMIGFDSMELDRALEGSQYLTQILFNEENLNMKLEKGFLGNPNVGSIVLRDALNKVFHNFKVDQGDRIFVVSSIFGGTGAAGFPLILKLLRENAHLQGLDEDVRDTIIGGVTVLPYFEVDDSKYYDGQSTINSNTFLTKTKAALSYYEDHVAELANAFYFAADNRMSAYDNEEGGKNQRNPAHFLEFASATAIVNFMAYEPGAVRVQDLPTQAKFFELGFNQGEDATGINLHDFFSVEEQETCLKPLIMFKLFGLYMTNFWDNSLRNNAKSPFLKDLGLNDKANGLNKSFVDRLKEYFDLHFYNWLYDMAREQHSRKFTPFYLPVENSDEIKKSLAKKRRVPVQLSVDDQTIFQTVIAPQLKQGKGMLGRKERLNFEKLFTDHLSHVTSQNLGDNKPLALTTLIHASLKNFVSEKIDQ